MHARALEDEIRLAPEDPWAWERLADLYLWEERPRDARDTLERAVALAPESEALHKARVRVLESTGSWSDVVAAYERFVADHEGSALGLWFLGTARYEVAIAGLLAGEHDQAEAFRQAEAELVRTRELEPSYEAACRGYEVVCRDGLGWSHYHAGDLELAAEAFWSMEELQEGGLRWEDPGRLFSGLRSLEFVVAAHHGRWMQLFEADLGVGYGEAICGGGRGDHVGPASALGIGTGHPEQGGEQEGLAKGHCSLGLLRCRSASRWVFLSRLRRKASLRSTPVWLARAASTHRTSAISSPRLRPASDGFSLWSP